MERPRVSVIVPAYNVAPYIGECLDSVLSQTYQDYEVIVVDDGSTDATPQVLRRYAGAIRCIRQENRGVSAARNAAVRCARGELIALLDGDDVWLPSYLERQIAIFDRLQGPVLVYADAYLWDGRTPPERLTETWTQREPPPAPEWNDVMRLLVWQFALPSATVVMRSVLLDAGLFDEAIHYGEDLDLWVRIARRGVRFVSNPEPLVLYRFRRPGSLTSGILRVQTGYARMLRRVLADPGFSDAERAMAARLLVAFASGLRGKAVCALLSGDVPGAREYLQASLEIEPNHLRARAALILAQWPRLARPILSAVYRLREYMP